ncbi:unnamed protein product [Callosobruchus maculatus]|uniref:DUF4371 domain-containing protein n=1 Tax=Callosobruchus maculatus TaxID=64391 RepID=A0A653CJJ6_CALMS|nr:unnamed protein product [Callosobruchus maculatus]
MRDRSLPPPPTQPIAYFAAHNISLQVSPDVYTQRRFADNIAGQAYEILHWSVSQARRTQFAFTVTIMATHRKGETIRGEAREVIARVIEACDEESRNHALKIPLHAKTERAAYYTGVSTTSIKRIRNENRKRNMEDPGSSLATPSAKRPRLAIEGKIDDFDFRVVRRTIEEFYIGKKTCTKLLVAIREKIDFPYSTKSLNRLLKEYGFCWKKYGNKRNILIEKPSIVHWRLKYLRAIKRYIVDGRPVERFWKFLQPSGHDSNAISACILNEISLLVDDPEKLIAQSYDGAAVMSGAINDVHKHVQERYPRANFVHCYAHQANLIMSHATSSNSDCRIFFANLTGLCTFFSTSPQQAARLEEFLHEKGLPRFSKIKWNFNSRTVNAVYEHREDIIGALEKIEREATSQTTIQQAGAHLRILEDESFIYWLTFFHKIMPHVDILFNQLQKVTTDALKIHNNIADFERAIGKIRSEIGNTETQPVDQNNSELTPPPSKRRRTADKSERRRQSIEVCDSILLEIKTRFQFIGHLILSKLVSFNQFPLFEKEFPEDFLKEAIKFYPCLNGGRLRTELSVLYSREEFRQSSETSAVGLLGLLQDGRLMSCVLIFEWGVERVRRLDYSPVHKGCHLGREFIEYTSSNLNGKRR